MYIPVPRSNVYRRTLSFTPVSESQSIGLRLERLTTPLHPLHLLVRCTGSGSFLSGGNNQLRALRRRRSSRDGDVLQGTQ